MKRIQIGLRLMLLLVALFAVTFAWLGALRDLRRSNLCREIHDMEFYRNYLLRPNGTNSFTSEQAWRDNLAETEAAIAERRRILGEPDP